MQRPDKAKQRDLDPAKGFDRQISDNWPGLAVAAWEQGTRMGPGAFVANARSVNYHSFEMISQKYPLLSEQIQSLVWSHDPRREIIYVLLLGNTVKFRRYEHLPSPPDAWAELNQFPSLSHYSSILEVLEDLCGEFIKTEGIPYRDELIGLIARIHANALTAKRLSDDPRLGIPIIGSPHIGTDIGTIGTLLRSSIDVYINLFEIFVEPDTPDRIEFEYCSWKIRGLSFLASQKQDKALANLASESHKTVTDQLNEFKAKIENTKHFQDLPMRSKKNVLRGFSQRDQDSWEALAERTGWNWETLKLSYAMYSADVHGASFFNLQHLTAPECERVYKVHSMLSHMMILLSKTILGLEGRYVQLADFFKSNEEIMGAIKKVAEFAQEKVSGQER